MDEKTIIEMMLEDITRDLKKTRNKAEDRNENGIVKEISASITKLKIVKKKIGDLKIE